MRSLWLLLALATGAAAQPLIDFGLPLSAQTIQRYAISVSGLPGITLDPVTEVEVLPTEVRSAAVRVQIPPGTAATGSHPIQFEIRSTGDEVARVTEKAAFLVPR